MPCSFIRLSIVVQVAHFPTEIFYIHTKCTKGDGNAAVYRFYRRFGRQKKADTRRTSRLLRRSRKRKKPLRRGVRHARRRHRQALDFKKRSIGKTTSFSPIKAPYYGIGTRICLIFLCYNGIAKSRRSFERCPLRSAFYPFGGILTERPRSR